MCVGGGGGRGGRGVFQPDLKQEGSVLSKTEQVLNGRYENRGFIAV